NIGTASTFSTSGNSLSNTGTIGGNGTLKLVTSGTTGKALTNGNGTLAGTLAPGNSPGALTINGDLVLTSTSVTSIEINSTGTPGVDYDVINVTGTASLGGTLAVTHLNGFSPGVGASFAIMSYAAHSGDFAIKSFPVAYNSTAGATSYGLDLG